MSLWCRTTDLLRVSKDVVRKMLEEAYWMSFRAPITIRGWMVSGPCVVL